MQDLSGRDFSTGWPELVALGAEEPTRWLGLLCLLAWADQLQRGIHLETLIHRLSDSCFLHLEAHHVWEALHRHFGRKKSFLHFVFDEVRFTAEGGRFIDLIEEPPLVVHIDPQVVFMIASA